MRAKPAIITALGLGIVGLLALRMALMGPSRLSTARLQHLADETSRHWAEVPSARKQEIAKAIVARMPERESAEAWSGFMDRAIKESLLSREDTAQYLCRSVMCLVQRNYDDGGADLLVAMTLPLPDTSLYGIDIDTCTMTIDGVAVPLELIGASGGTGERAVESSHLWRAIGANAGKDLDIRVDWSGRLVALQSGLDMADVAGARWSGVLAARASTASLARTGNGCK